MLTGLQYVRLGVVASAAMIVSACESTGSLRLASVGSVPDGSTASSGSSGGDGATSSSSGGSSSSSSGASGGPSGGGTSGSDSANALGAGKILVTAGNTVIGVAGTTRKVNGGVSLPATGLVTGTVTRVLRKTGQTLVDIGQGNMLILGKAGGAVGDPLRIDLGSHTVVSAPNRSALLGAAVLSPAGSGNLVAVPLNRALDLTSGASGGLLRSGLANGLSGSPTGGVAGSVSGSATAGGSATTTTPQTPVTGAATTVGGVAGGAVNATTGVLGGLGGTVTKKGK